jgi:hypothetical protein
MSEPEINSPEISESADLKQQVAALRRQAAILQFGLVIASLTLTAYLGLQSRHSGKDVEAVRQQGMEATKANKSDEAGIKMFVAKLAEYGVNHPDYAAILKRYNIAPSTNTNTLSPANVPSPVK